MPTLTEGKLACTFPDNWDATKYDDWAFYRNRFVSSCCGNKAVDFLAIDPVDEILWLIELKDFRQFARSKDIPLWEEVAIKARDTLAGICAVKMEAGNENQAFAQTSLTMRKIRVVLHLEQPAQHSKLFPRAFDPADVQQKIKQLIKPIDAHPAVVQLSRMANVAWTAESIP